MIILRISLFNSGAHIHTHTRNYLKAKYSKIRMNKIWILCNVHAQRQNQKKFYDATRTTIYRIEMHSNEFHVIGRVYQPSRIAKTGVVNSFLTHIFWFAHSLLSVVCRFLSLAAAIINGSKRYSKFIIRCCYRSKVIAIVTQRLVSNWNSRACLHLSYINIIAWQIHIIESNYLADYYYHMMIMYCEYPCVMSTHANEGQPRLAG